MLCHTNDNLTVDQVDRWNYWWIKYFWLFIAFDVLVFDSTQLKTNESVIMITFTDVISIVLSLTLKRLHLLLYCELFLMLLLLLLCCFYRCFSVCWGSLFTVLLPNVAMQWLIDYYVCWFLDQCLTSKFYSVLWYSKILPLCCIDVTSFALGLG